VIQTCLVAFAAIYVLCFGVALPAYIDEAYSYNLLADPSLAHMLSSLAHGADGAFPAYPLFAFAWAKVFGASELSLRLTGGLFVILFVWQCGGRLLRRFSPTAAGLALLFVLATQNFIFYTIQTRFYGLVIFLFSLVFWSTWDMVEEKAVSHWRRWGHAFACGLLCLSHPLGVVYAGILGLLYQVFAGLRKSWSWANAASFLGGPLCLAAWLPAFLLQKGVNGTYPPGQTVPGWGKYLEFVFLDSKVLCGVVLIGAALLVLVRRAQPAPNTQLTPTSPDGQVGGSILDVGCWMFLRSQGSGNTPAPPGNALLIAYALAFILALNAAMALLDAARVVPIYLMQAVRYVLVSAVAYAVIVAGVWERAERLLRRARQARWGTAVSRLLPVLILAALLAGMAVSWSRWLLEKSHMESTLAQLAKLAGEKHLPIVCEDHESAFYLATRTGATDVRFVLSETAPFSPFLRLRHKYYPQPAPISLAESRQLTNDFVLLPAAQPPVIVTHSAAPPH
jgi:hypothetical protein